MNNSDWMATAACRGQRLDRFFRASVESNLESGVHRHRSLLAKARIYCDACPVRQACLDYAHDTESVGIWAGVEMSERYYRRRREGKVPDRVIGPPVGSRLGYKVPITEERMLSDKEIVYRYEQGESIRGIARATGLGYGTVQSRVKEAGVSRPRGGGYGR